MVYPISILPSIENLETCPRFTVGNFLWTCHVKPATFGWLGYLPGHGFPLRMVCQERNPKRTLYRPQDMVCKNSAMEAFFAFPDHPLAPDEVFLPINNGLYFNFEINANGAMYAKYGKGRQNRQFISPQEYQDTGVRAWIDEEYWQIDLLIPLTLIHRVTGLERFVEGDTLYCNFYKIAEDPHIQHYASFHPIQSLHPNFHLPEQFAKAVIKGGCPHEDL